MNQWPIIGGVANVMCHESEYTLPNFGKEGDVIVLTKPLGTQVAVNLHEWMIEDNEKWKRSNELVTVEEAKNSYYLSMESMSHLNKNTAKLMKKYNCHGATDITGFGLLGHAQNLANVQREELDIVIHSLPIIDKMDVINKNILNFK
jgi:selenide,water dikinase